MYVRACEYVRAYVCVRAFMRVCACACVCVVVYPQDCCWPRERWSKSVRVQFHSSMQTTDVFLHHRSM